jgi:hypothetical protein
VSTYPRIEHVAAWSVVALHVGAAGRVGWFPGELVAQLDKRGAEGMAGAGLADPNAFCRLRAVTPSFCVANIQQAWTTRSRRGPTHDGAGGYSPVLRRGRGPDDVSLGEADPGFSSFRYDEVGRDP